MKIASVVLLLVVTSGLGIAQEHILDDAKGTLPPRTISLAPTNPVTLSTESVVCRDMESAGRTPDSCGCGH